MSLLKKYLESVAPTGNREIHYGVLVSYTPSAPATVKGEPKERVLAIVKIGDSTCQFYLFRDSISGLPNFVPATGVPMSITLQESKPDANGKTYLNAVAMGVGA